MERVTHLGENGHYYMTGDGIYGMWSVPEKYTGDDVDTIGKIEDILGDDYDLDRFRELVEADRVGRCKILPVNLGDTVYYIGGIHGKLVCEAKVEEIYIGDDTISLGVTSGFGVFTLEENEYFLTKESAEAALKGEAYGG